jgi:hypothetical protein
MQPLEPIDVPWTMKPLESARTSVERVDHGRMRFSIQHELIRGVTPAMLVWWLDNMVGDVEIGGRVIPRYRAWHPRDHVKLTYVRPADDGRNFGPGAQVRIQEFFGADPRYPVDVVATVAFLDETGFEHAEWVGGQRVAHALYSFVGTPEGTLYENSLTVGLETAGLGDVFNRAVVQPWLFPEEMGRAWLRHNVEEVGNFEFFLPALYAQHHPGA